MVRPAASDVNKSIALTFAASITQITHNTADIVARCGRCGLFSALSDVYPQIVRDGLSGVRDGISEVEFNKTLQVAMRLEVELSARNSHGISIYDRQGDLSASATADQAP
jgi:hypothetical protein